MLDEAASIDRLGIYLPRDRRHALVSNEVLPDRAEGSTLFADISGFTSLTEMLARILGPLRGAEEVTYYLEQIYTALIAEVHRYGGSVIGFSGDAVTCWFDGDGGERALGTALAMQRAMQPFTAVQLPNGDRSGLAVKVAVASGPVRRFLVGDPSIRQLDVLAGRTLVRLAATEHLAERGEVLADEEMGGLEASFVLAERRHDADSGGGAVVVTEAKSEIAPSPWPELPAGALQVEQMSSWFLPAVFERASRGTEALLANFRPAAALFLSFQGIDYDAEAAAGERLDAFVRWVQRVVDGLGGSIIQLTIGDKGSYLYAAFGAPVTHDDDASRAVAAALQLREPPPELGIRDVRIGLTHGQMYTGTYGSNTRRTYGVLGDKTNLAARLMGRADIGQVLCDPDLVRIARDRWHFVPLPPIMVKGKSEPIEVAAAVGERHRALGAEGRNEGRLVGREGDLMRLEALLDQLLAGKGRITEFVGEAGIGKSRLVRAVADLALDGGATVLEGAGGSVRQQVPYWAWRDVIQASFGLDEEDKPEQRRQRVTRYVRTVLPTMIDRLPLLNDILALGFAETPFTTALDAGLRQENLGQLLVALMQRLASEHPVVLILEDAQWLDSLSWELMARFARAVIDNDMPVWLMLVSRPLDPTLPDGHPEARQNIAMRSDTFRLSPLGPQGLRALLADRLDIEASLLPPEIVRLVEQRSNGNPFFAEELLRTLQEQKLLTLERRGEKIHPRVAEALLRGDMTLPNTLQGLILSRVDRLTLDDQLVLKVAAVIGLTFGLQVLRTALTGIGGIDGERLPQSLLELIGVDMIRQEAVERQSDYAFSHLLTHEVVYQTLLFAQRRILHRAVAEWYEQRYHDRIDEILPTLAHHFRRGVSSSDEPDLIRRAVDVILRAGDQYGRLGAYPEALSAFEDALAMLPSEQAWISLRADLLIRSGEVYEKVGDYPAATRSFGGALKQGREIADRPLEVRSLNGLCLVGTRQGEYETAHEAGEQALEIAGQIGDEIGMAGARSRLGILAFYGGAFDEANGHFGSALELYRHLRDDERTSSALNSLGMVAAVRESYEAASGYFEEALEIARRIQDRNATGKYLANLGLVAEKEEDFELAAERYRESLEIFLEIGARQDAVMNLFNLGLVEFALGRDEQARSYHLQALGQALELGALPVALAGLIGIAGVEARCGNPEWAAELLGLALSHPAINTEVEQNAEAVLELVRDALDSEIFEAQMAKGREHDLEAVARELQQAS